MIDGSSPRDAVSVVVPARNAASTLAEQLQALSNQTYDGLVEVVVVDNASSDSTSAVVGAASARNSLIRLIHEPNIGINNARNAGFAAASHELVLICDADDVVDIEWVASLVGGLGEADFAGGRMRFGRFNSDLALARLGVEPGAKDFVGTPGGGNCAIRRRVWSDLGGFNPAFSGAGDDTEFFVRALAAGFTMQRAPAAIVDYRLPETLRAILRRHHRFARDRVVRPASAAHRPKSQLLRSAVWVCRSLPMLPFSARRRATTWRVIGTQSGAIAGSILIRRYSDRSAQSAR